MRDESGDVISLNGDQRRTTNINIKKIIGTFEDFILTSMSLQNNNTVFIDKTQKERKEILAQFMGIGVFDDLYNRAIDEISDVSAVLKNFKQNDYGIELANVESELASKESHHTELKSQYLTLKEKRVIIDEKILDLNKRLKPIDDSILDLDDLESQKTILVDGLESIDTQLGVISSTRNENIINEDELNIRINQHVSDNVNNLFLEYKQHELDRAETKIDIDKLKINVRNKLDKIEKLGNLEYDDNCDYCMNNPFTLDAIDTKSQLDHDKALASEYVVKIDNLDSILESMKWVHQAKIDFDTSIESIKNIEISKNKLDSESTLCIEMKKNIIHQISLIESKILDHNEKQSDIEYNVNIERNLVALELEVVDLNESIVSVDLNINDVYGDVKVLDSKKISILETIDKVTDLEDRYAAYEYYLDAIKRDGVPYELITKALPAIEGAVNDILAQIVDFSIILEMYGKNINTYIVYDDDNVWPLELSSGMERFVSSLAIRVGLINVSNLPRSNFLAIDEGFGNMDADNLNSVYQLFQYLKSQFQFTMVVSHIESMRDAVDSLIEIKKENDFSNVNYI
jgi:DNA repair exonuclease SbcCD ATPase subunit